MLYSESERGNVLRLDALNDSKDCDIIRLGQRNDLSRT